MKTPREYQKNLQNKIITVQMLDDALWSVNKRAKNWRDKKREYRRCLYDKYYNFEKAEVQEREYYNQKDELLSLISPVCIHREDAGYQRTRVYDYEPNYQSRFISHLLGNEVVRG